MGADMKAKMVNFYQRFRGSGGSASRGGAGGSNDGSHQRLVDNTSSDDDEVIAWDSEGASGTQQRRHVLDRSADRGMEMQEMSTSSGDRTGRSKDD